MTRLQRIHVSAVVGLMAACSTTAPPAESLGVAPIINGTIDETDLAVVAIASEGTIFCTGTLVGARVIVTAAHCIDGVYGQGPLDAFFGAAANQAGRTVPIAYHRKHPAYDASSHINDIALLLLAAPAPADVTPIPMLRTPPAQWVGERIRLVGFGRTAPDVSPKVKHEGTTSISEVTDTEFSFLPDPSLTCFGDSGGPAFLTVDGVEYLTGVTSRGDALCADHGIDTRVDQYLVDFIDPFVGETSPGAAATGEPCFFDAQCTSGPCVVAEDDEAVRYCSKACVADDDCSVGMLCAAGAAGGECRHPTPTPRAFAAVCNGPENCASGVCIAFDEGSSICSRRCAPSTGCGESASCDEYGTLPNHFACAPASDGGGGCAIAARGSSAPRWAGVALVLALLLLRRRRAARP